MDICRQPWATSCPWRRDPSLAPWAPAQGGARWGAPEPGQAAGVSKRWWRGEPGAGPPAQFRLWPLHLVARCSGQPCASGTGCLGVCEAVAVALRVPWASGQKPLLQGIADVCWGHCTILRAPALISPFSRGCPSISFCEVFFLTEPAALQPALPPPSPHAQDDLSCACHPQPALASGTVSSASFMAIHRQHVGTAHGVDRMKRRKVKAP